MGIYRCEGAMDKGRLPRLTPRNDELRLPRLTPRNDGTDKRHPEEQSDVGIYLCEDAMDKDAQDVILNEVKNLLEADKRRSQKG